MRNIKGFDIKFEFYSNWTLIRSCDDLKPGIDPRPFFRNIVSFGTRLKLENGEIHNSNLSISIPSDSMPNSQIKIDCLIDTFHKRNVLEFHHLDNVTDINSSVTELFI